MDAILCFMGYVITPYLKKKNAAFFEARVEARVEARGRMDIRPQLRAPFVY